MISQGLLIDKKEEQLEFFSSSKTSIEDEGVNYKIIQEKELDSFVNEIQGSKEVCFDTETSSLNIQEAELAGIAFSIKSKEAYYVPTIENTIKIINKLKPILENKNIKLIGHNLKYDVQILKKYNVSVSENVFDTMIAHYLINPESSHKLDVLSENYLNHKCISIEELIGKKGPNQKKMTDLSPNEIYKYACEDA